MNSILENQFFYSACQGLIDEGLELRNLFGSNSTLYKNHHNGISCIYETTMVYTVLKRLLKDNFPLMISWEHPYPKTAHLKSDLATINEDNTINSLVEFKIWLSEDGK